MDSLKSLGKKFGQKVWAKSLEKKFGQKVWAKRLDKKFGEKVWRKSLDVKSLDFNNSLDFTQHPPLPVGVWSCAWRLRMRLPWFEFELILRLLDFIESTWICVHPRLCCRREKKICD